MSSKYSQDRWIKAQNMTRSPKGNHYISIQVDNRWFDVDTKDCRRGGPQSYSSQQHIELRTTLGVRKVYWNIRMR